MHDGGVLVGHLELVDEGRGVLVEEDAEVWRHVVHQDVDVAVPVRQLVFVDQANGVTDLVQVQTFLPNRQHGRFEGVLAVVRAVNVSRIKALPGCQTNNR